nr:MAG: hypothetical protein [Caudoviricetes sp.]
MTIYEHKTYRYYPKYISTLILSDYIAKQTKETNKIHNFNIDDLYFKYRLSDGGHYIIECLVNKEKEFYDYFCIYHADPELKPDEII